MFNYIKADLYRLFRKRSNYLYYAVLIGLFMLILLFTYNHVVEMPSWIYFPVGVGGVATGGSMLIGAQAYYTVYLEDFSVKKLPDLFTTGLRKYEYILAKVIVQAIYLFIVIALTSLLYIAGFFILQTKVDTPLVGFDMAYIWAFLQAIVIMYFGTLAYSMISQLVGFLFQRSDIPLIFFFILVNGLITQTLTAMTNLSALSFLENVVDFSLTEALNTSFTEVVNVMGAGSVMTTGFYEIIFVGFTYMVVFTILSWLLLRQVEIKE